MNIPYIRAPHVEGAPSSTASAGAPNAALLIDFDNVTMGMRSDLSKELKTLLQSDVIRGKVTVQRAYADWRRYPQYIVPLSEASVDLIFAPAYGSSKKNATDIRMAIDGMELVFTRPEIGTYILLTGDSDFSSLVLKLKEYGKYVIGVGIQESSSDILVQNCDEYYSYTSLSGLRKTGSGEQRSQQDPWSLAERAVEQMTKRRDVMRSDRLKQVMLELDSTFDEKSIGFSKFSRFLTEAAQKGILELKKLDNGQYEVASGRGSGRGSSSGETGESRSSSRRERDDSRSGGRGGRGRSRDREETPAPASEAPTEEAVETAPRATRETAEKGGRASGGAEGGQGSESEGASADPARLRAAYDLMIRAVEELAGPSGDPVRDSDVKRRMLALEASFDEAELGFSKFSRFLRQAHDHEVVDLTRGDNGVYELRVKDGVAAFDRVAGRGKGSADTGSTGKAASTPTPEAAGTEEASTGRGGRAKSPTPSTTTETPDGRRLRPRLSARRRGGSNDEPPPFLEGQAVATPSLSGGKSESGTAEPEASGGAGGESAKAESGKSGGRTPRPRKSESPKAETRKSAPAKTEAAKGEAPRSGSAGGASDLDQLGLPSGPEATAQYLMNSYKGVGKKTADTLVQAHGDRLFHVLDTDPDAIRGLLPAARAEGLLEQWIDDVARRRAELHGPAGRKPAEGGTPRSGGGRRRTGSGGGGGRRRGGSGGRSRS